MRFFLCKRRRLPSKGEQRGFFKFYFIFGGLPSVPIHPSSLLRPPNPAKFLSGVSVLSSPALKFRGSRAEIRPRCPPGCAALGKGIVNNDVINNRGAEMLTRRPREVYGGPGWDFSPLAPTCVSPG